MSTKESPILVINNGSSSLKYSVLDPKSEAVLSSGLAERIGTEEAFLKLTDLEQVSHQEELGRADHRSALLRVIEILSKKGQFDCRAIGHRIVHGGEYFRDPVLVTDSVLQKIKELAALAWLRTFSRANHKWPSSIRPFTRRCPPTRFIMRFHTSIMRSIGSAGTD